MLITFIYTQIQRISVSKIATLSEYVAELTKTVIIAFLLKIEQLLNKVNFSYIIHPTRKARMSMTMVVAALAMITSQGTAAVALSNIEEAQIIAEKHNNFLYTVNNSQTVKVHEDSPQIPVIRDSVIIEAPIVEHYSAYSAPARQMAPGDLDAAQAYASSLVGGGEQFNCLYTLWAKESGWRWNAGNSSGAYGIPQALPGSKMASAGEDWETNYETQIRWGLGYIEGRYGTPCDALNHSENVGWY